MSQVRFGPQITPAVKGLIIINVVIYIVQFISSLVMQDYGASNQIQDIFSLDPKIIVNKFYFWQIFTYQFLHSQRDIMHILFNMFALWMFGSELEEKWGKKFFTRYYLVCGTGAGVFIFLIPVLLGQVEFALPTIGASGAVYGILLAYAVYWPDRYLLFMFIIPVKVKYFVLVMGLVSFYFTLQTTGTAGGISHVGHFGGLLTGYFYLFYLVKKKNHPHPHSFTDKWNFIKRYKTAKKRREWQKKEQEKYDMMHMEEKIDAILDKISRHGIKSLSAYEKKFLRKASDNMNESKKKTGENNAQLH
ncbi:MAG: rhomboid family intramembrane serine protease [Spirochaetia bacterium]|nr:rhomboid family intramembrane serine protease [Spirochaetia bacterium]